MKTKHCVIFLCLALSAHGAWAQDALSLTVDEAVRLALENNLGLKRSGIEFAATKRDAGRAWNSLIPALKAGAQISHPTSLTNEIPAAQDEWSQGVSLGASLTLSASVPGAIQKARLDYEKGAITYNEARAQLELQVRKLFYQLILLRSNLALEEESLANAEARYRQSAAFARAGQASLLDEMTSRVDMENQRPTVRNAQMQYENALDSFVTLLGIPARDVTLTGSLEEAVETAAGTATESAPNSTSVETQLAQKTIGALKAQRASARAGAYLPALSFAWNSAPLYNANTSTWNDAGSLSIALSLSIDNFLPWSPAKSQIDTLSDNIRAAQIQLQESLETSASRRAQLERTIKKTTESIAALRLNVELAQKTYALSYDAYQKGGADYQQLRDMANSLSQAQNRVMQEQYNLISALLDLEKELNLPLGGVRTED